MRSAGKLVRSTHAVSSLPSESVSKLTQPGLSRSKPRLTRTKSKLTRRRKLPGQMCPRGSLSQGLDALSHDLSALSEDLLADDNRGDWPSRHTSVVARIVDLKEGETGRFDRNRREHGKWLRGRHRQSRSRRGSGRKSSRSTQWSRRRWGTW